MTSQMVKHSVSKVAGLGAIAATVALLTLPAIAGMGGSQQTGDKVPVTEAPVSPSSTTPSSTTPGSMTPSSTTPGSTTPGSTVPTTSETRPADAATSGTIVEVATANGSFKTLVRALKAAGLTAELSGKGPYTVFAPTDAAFAALPPGVVERLLQPENKQTLKKILTYHVVPGSVRSTALKQGKVKTVEGATVDVSLKGSDVMVNNAKVTTPDIQASNGVIHVIDQVIIPPTQPGQ